MIDPPATTRRPAQHRPQRRPLSQKPLHLLRQPAQQSPQQRHWNITWSPHQSRPKGSRPRHFWGIHSPTAPQRSRRRERRFLRRPSPERSHSRQPRLLSLPRHLRRGYRQTFCSRPLTETMASRRKIWIHHQRPVGKGQRATF
jgi:hypothetical protein